MKLEMDQKQIPPTNPPHMDFQAPPAYDQHQNFPKQYPVQPMLAHQAQPMFAPQGQPQVITSEIFRFCLKNDCGVYDSSELKEIFLKYNEKKFCNLLIFNFSNRHQPFRTRSTLFAMPKLPQHNNNSR